jgi:hypothetical protein
VKRQVQDTTEEEKEFLRFQEKQTQIQRLRALNLHLPFSVYTEGQGLDDEDLEHVVNHVKGDWKHPEPPPRIKRVSVIKGVLEARDPHDSPGVEAMRQQLLEDFEGTVSRIGRVAIHQSEVRMEKQLSSSNLGQYQ